jgi:thiamine biosynthesis lipoprotein
MERVVLARQAMATRFEIVLHGNNPVALRAAGEEALAEIERLDAALSLFNPASEVYHLNSKAALKPFRVTAELFALLLQARNLHEKTDEAFDITVAPLMNCWGFLGGTGRLPDPAAIEKARELIGMRHLIFDTNAQTIQYSRDGVMIDLGAIGKGYAVQRASEILRDLGIKNALVHGGTSSVAAIGEAEPGRPWKIAVEVPLPDNPAESALVAVVPLREESLSVSAVWGKSFREGENLFGHVLDPRQGRPVSSAVLSAVRTSSALLGDVLSTALLISGHSGHDMIHRVVSNSGTLVIGRTEGVFELSSMNFAVEEGLSSRPDFRIKNGFEKAGLQD